VFIPVNVARARVVSSEISGNIRKFVKEFFQFILFNYKYMKKIKNKHVLDKQLSRS